MRRAALLLALLSVAATAAAVLAADVTVPTQYGPVRGFTSPISQQFLGVPFVAPPVGALRWADPAPPQPWSAPLDVKEFKPGCPQDCELPPDTCPLSTSEDCIYLNVFTPLAAKAGADMPVMVFLPGGRFMQGSAGVTLYNGSHLAASSNTIVVTVAYRLGIFGFFYSDGLGGNFGLKDQLAALEWVQKNIANFGGDPQRVTLFGQSAGATSTSVHLTSPRATGLFSRAIIESNPFSLRLKTQDEARSFSERFTDALKCKIDDVACLRGATADAIVAAQGDVQNHLPLLHPLEMFMPFTPVVDGDYVLDQPLRLIQRGIVHQVPVMLGTVNDEGIMFVFSAWNGTVPHVDYDAVIVGVFREHALGVLEQYPYDNTTVPGDGRYEMGTLATDFIFACSTRNAATHLAAAGVPVWLYHFDHVLSFPAWGPLYTICDKTYVCHGSELPFVFHSHAPFEFTAPEVLLSNDVMARWTNFAHSADPNKGQNVSPQWPAFSSSALQVLELTAHGDSVQTGYRAEQCAHWDRWGYFY